MNFQGFTLFSYQGSFPLLSRSRESAWLYYHEVFGMSSLFFNFFHSFFFIIQSNGEGGIWPLAPLLTTYSLSRGAPSASLGTSPKCPIQWICNCLSLLSQWQLTERVGFEPTRPCGQTVFKTASLWPLRYLSVCNSRPYILCTLTRITFYH